MGKAAILSKNYKMRWWTLVVIAISVLVVVLDSTIVNIALPTLQRELGATFADLQWMINIYIMIFAALMLSTGALGDRIGRKKMLQAGIILFGISSLFASMANTSGGLILWRAIMGVGGAMMLPATLAIITNVFPREERGKAIGVWAGLNGIGIALGPIIGGVIIENLNWNWIFLVNIPITVIALAAGLFLIPESRDPNPKKLDILGTLLSSAALALLVFGLIKGSDWGWTNPGVLGSLAGAVVAGLLFMLWERKTENPMLEMVFFKNARFSAGVFSVSMMALSMIGITFGLTLYMQFVAGYTALETGVRFVPLALGVFIGAGSSDKVVEKLGTTKVITLGYLGTALILLAASFWEVNTAYWQLGILFFFFGFFLGYIAAPATTAVMGALPEARAGIGSAMNTVSRMVAGSIGVATLGSILSSLYTSNFNSGINVVTGLPVEVIEASSESVGAAVTIAESLPVGASEALLTVAKESFMDAWQIMAFISLSLCVIGALIVVRVMPPRYEPVNEPATIVAEVDK
ncbi:MAG: MFS transporter [Dehalococcoidia bacterium]|nr:MAG: MFS transporter [Dehalococcoidia bacterium]